MRSPHNLLRMLAACLRPRRRLLGYALVTVAALNLLDLAIPKCLQIFVDALMESPLAIGPVSLEFFKTPRGQMIVLPGLLLALALGRWLITYARAILESRLAQGSLFDLRSRIFNTMQNLSFSYHDKTHTGLLISHIVEDVNYASQFLQFGLFPVIECVIYIAIAYAIMALVCWPAALASGALLLISSAGIWVYFRYGQPFFSRTKKLFAETIQLFTENMEGHLVVRAFAGSKRQRKLYGQRVEKMHRAMLTENYLSTFMSQSMVWANAFGVAAIAIVSVWFYQRGMPGLTVGKIVMLFYIHRSIMPRIRMLGRAFDLLMRFKITADRLEDILFGSTSYLPDDGDRKLPHQGPGKMELQNISFRYPDASPVLRDVSTVIEAGTTVALVGATGSGKTTLAMLLTRFYDPSDGMILLDGADIREFPVKQVRDQFSLVFQDTFLFSASIYDNIAYGAPDASPEQIIHAATLAQAHDFIMDTPDGYSTVVGERGVTLSGGQRQRISIARAILRRPRFLVLDACTAAVDNLTEKAIQEGLNALRETSTIIIIAQRYSSVENADRVCVFENGVLIEDGTPASLNQPGTAFSRILDAPTGGAS